MSGLDQKGPQGKGPMTGRKAGRCTNFEAGKAGKEDASTNEAEENAPVTGGRGRGRGQGGGRGSGTGAGRGRGAGR